MGMPGIVHSVILHFARMCGHQREPDLIRSTGIFARLVYVNPRSLLVIAVVDIVNVSSSVWPNGAR